MTRTLRKVDRGYVAAGGLVVAGVGYGLLTQVHVQSPLWFVLIGASVYAGGVIGAMTVGNELIMGAVSPERAGAAAAVVETASEFGGALGMAVLGSIGIAVYRSDLTASAPVHLPGGVIGAARSTLGGAISEAARLPGRLGPELKATARAAFAHGLDAAALGAAVAVLAPAIATVRYFRGVRVVPAENAGQRPQSELVS